MKGIFKSEICHFMMWFSPSYFYFLVGELILYVWVIWQFVSKRMVGGNLKKGNLKKYESTSSNFW